MPPTPASRKPSADGSSTHRTVVRAVAPATVDLAREHSHHTLSRRLVADRANIEYQDLCAHFASIETLIAETCLDALHQSPLVVEFDASPRQRMVAQFHQLIMLLAFEPRYGTACVWALMSNDKSVRAVRAEVDSEIRRRVSAALGSGAWPELVSTLQMTLLGAVVQAATNTASLVELSQRLGDLVDMLLPGREHDAAPVH